MMRHLLIYRGTSFRFVLFCLCLSSIATTGFGADPASKTLHGHVPAAVIGLSPKANLPGTNRLNLAIGLPLRDEPGLNSYLAELYDPASAHYRRYLTPEQFTEKFGPTEKDYGAVIDFARRNHLTVTTKYRNRLLLDVNGSVA